VENEKSQLDQLKFKKSSIHFGTTLYEQSDKVCLHFTEVLLVNTLQVQERSGNLNQVLSISVFLDLLTRVSIILRRNKKLDAVSFGNHVTKCRFLLSVFLPLAWQTKAGTKARERARPWQMTFFGSPSLEKHPEDPNLLFPLSDLQ